MTCGKRLSIAVFCSCCLLAGLLLPPAPVFAQTAHVISRITPEAGRIADIAALSDGHLYLLYPAEGRITAR